MKILKKILAGIIFGAVGLLFLFNVTSCGDSNSEGNSTTQGPDKSIVVTNFDKGVVKFDSDELNADNKITGNLYAGQVYYLIMKVTYHPDCNTSGNDIVQANLKLYNIAVIEGTLDSANSSQTKKMEFVNSNDEKNCMATVVDFKIPENKNQDSSMLIKIKLTPRFPTEVTERIADCRIALNVTTTDYKVTGEMNNGTTFTLHVERTKIEAPVIDWNAKKYSLEWKHVLYADYYEIYIEDDESPLTTYKVASSYSVGDVIVYSKLEDELIKASVDTSEEIRVRIRAVANPDTTGIEPAQNYESTFSNSIYIQI